MNPPSFAPILPASLHAPLPTRPAVPLAAQAVLQRRHAPRQLTLELRPRG
jgi:hypothetical protein